MHEFSELVWRAAESSLNAYSRDTNRIHEALQVVAPTSLIKELQTIQVQKAILAG